MSEPPSNKKIKLDDNNNNAITIVITTPPSSVVVLPKDMIQEIANYLSNKDFVNFILINKETRKSLIFDQENNDENYYYKIRRQGLCATANYGDIKGVKFLYSIGITFSNTIPIFFIAKQGHLEMVKFLYSVGMSFDQGMLNTACEFGHFDMVKFLYYTASIKPNKMTMIEACRGKNLEVAKFLISIHAFVHSKAMDLAASNGWIEFVKDLHSIGIICSETAMNDAAAHGHLETVKYLHSIGAKCTYFALYFAADNGYLDMVKFLHSIGVRWIHIYAAAQTCEYGHLEILKYLHYKMGVSFCDKDSIYYAARHGHFEVIKFLHSIDVKFSKEAIDEAEKCGHEEIAKYLKEIGASVS